MGKSTVFVNGQGMSSSNSGAVAVGGPDVCLTPVGNSLVPIPYTNTARSVALAGGTKTVKIDGGMGAIDGSRYRTSTGDEAGICNGLRSGTVGGDAEFINSSFDVKVEGRGACRNLDEMTHNNRNATGVNYDSCAPPPDGEAEEAQENGVFRIKVVEHLSWDAYDHETKSFRLGHKDNKPIAGRKFKITMPDGSVVEKTTDDDGVIELTEQERCGKYEVTFEPEAARLNNSYFLYYNGFIPLEVCKTTAKT